jgi:hypothetical protein
MGMVNYIAVVAAGLFNMVLGMIWYHPKVFGTLWMKAMGKKEKEMDKPGMGPRYLVAMLSSFVFALILALIINMTGTTSTMEGAILGATVWLGFVATACIPAMVFEGKSPRVYLIFVVYQLIVYIVAGALLTSWVY